MDIQPLDTIDTYYHHLFEQNQYKVLPRIFLYSKYFR